MRDGLRLGMPTRLLLGFATVILPLAVFAAWSYDQTLDDRRQAALQDQVQLARTAAAVMHGILREFDTTMLAMSHTLALQDRPLDQTSVGPLLASMAERYPFVRAIFLIGPDGRVLATPTGQTLGTDLSRQPYVVAMVGGQDFVLTDVMPGVETGTPIVVMGRTIRAPDGRLRGMLAFGFYPSRLTDVFPGALPEETRLNVVDRRGTLIYSSVGPDIAREGRDLSDQSTIQSALAGQPASGDFVSSIDGQPRIGAAVPVADYGWAVSVSRSRASVEGRLDELFRRHVLLIAVVAAAALLLAWFLSRALTRPLARLVEEAQRFGHGELSRPEPVAGPPEVEALARALDAMAADLRERFDDREAALAGARAALDVRDQFLSVAAHELRTPLTALKGQVQIARRRLMRRADPAELDEFLARADTQIDRLAELVGDLLDVARIAAGHFPIERQPVDAAQLIRHAVELEQALTPQRHIELDLLDQLPAIEADGGRMEQVLLNLLENARKYSPDGTPIRVTATSRDGWLEIAVQDEGPGIPSDEREAIFERFRRASNVDRNVSGLGLGLYIVREIVVAHSGRLTVEAAPGGGSVFRVLLPLTPVAATDAAAPASVPAQP